MNDDIIIIERFSKKRYETYKAKGIPFHVVCGKGRLLKSRLSIVEITTTKYL